jgi:peptidyl-prolyl cis-trans isomerase
MLVEKDRKVALSYVLVVDGKEVDRAESSNPLEFVYGHGRLLPRFEENIVGLAEGDEFSFELTPEEGYGEYREQNIVRVPKDIFVIEGKLQEDLLRIGSEVPMQMRGGGTMIGRVKEVGESEVTMDFNHELAGKFLQFSGRVEHVDEVSSEELAAMHEHHCCCGGHGDCDEGGCGCGDHGHGHCHSEGC